MNQLELEANTRNRPQVQEKRVRASCDWFEFYRISPRIGRTFFKEKNVQNLGCGLYAGTRVLSSLICKISRHTQSRQSY